MNGKIRRKQFKGKRIFLRHPVREDAGEFIEKAYASRRFHKWLVKPPATEREFFEYVEKTMENSNECFLICARENGEIIGAVNLSQIFYGGFRNAYLGYYVFNEFAGKGFMSEALNLVLEIAFRKLKLHRLEANIQPENLVSKKLAANAGFTLEGFSRKYLKIAGRWRDHERWAIIREDWVESKKIGKK